MARVDSEWEELLKKSQPSVFSDGIMFEILSRLPVKSIIRFKSVCKKWLELFGDSGFIAASLKQSVEVSNSCNLFYKRVYEGGNALRVGYYLSDENFEDLCELPLETEPSTSCDIVASVDGLVCIRNVHTNLKISILLWNPATRESRTLPGCPANIHYLTTAVGFGFDPKNNDYKVVMMTPIEGSIRIDVYSLITDRWRSFEIEFFYAYTINGAHVNGSLHWLAVRTEFDRFMVSFDLTDEKITEICLPVNLNLDGLVLLKSLGKSLIVLLRNYEMEAEIWFMKKYGDSKSWSKLYSIPPHPMYGCILLNQGFLLENGKVIMHCSHNHNMISYDLENQVYKILHTKGCKNIVKYKESLVSVYGDGSFSKP